MMPRSTQAAAATVSCLAENAQEAIPPVGMRLDRSVSIHVVHPILVLLGGRREGRVPILMYHGIGAGGGGRHPYFETATSPLVFEQHMQFLAESGFKSVTV